jgi:hypothetical protein
MLELCPLTSEDHPPVIYVNPAHVRCLYQGPTEDSTWIEFDKQHSVLVSDPIKDVVKSLIAAGATLRTTTNPT